MASYKIELKRSAVKEIERLPKSDLKRVLAKIESLSLDPRGADSVKLSGEEKYRVRVGHTTFYMQFTTMFLLSVWLKLDIAKMFINKDKY